VLSSELVAAISQCEECKTFGITGFNRERFLAHAAEFLPPKVRLLIVAPWPPAASPATSFYHKPLSPVDTLFREIMISLGIMNEGQPSFTKLPFLCEFARKGYYLVYAARCPADGSGISRKARAFILSSCSHFLADEIKQLEPENIIIVDHLLFDPVREMLTRIGYADKLAYTKRIPFPIRGEQPKFRQILARVARKVGELSPQEAGRFPRPARPPAPGPKAPAGTPPPEEIGEGSVFIIDNITSNDIAKNQVRVMVSSKPYFPSEKRGEPRAYPITLVMGEEACSATFRIGSRDRKSRSGVLKLGKELTSNLGLSSGARLRFTILEKDRKYKVEKVQE